jgi:hypothetical protein
MTAAWVYDSGPNGIGKLISASITAGPDDGNQTAGLGRSISYTSYNKPSSITQGSTTLFFSHDPNHARFKQSAPEGIMLYFDVFGIHAELFEAATSQWNEYLMVGCALVGARFERSAESISTRYFTTDHLGSVAVITGDIAFATKRGFPGIIQSHNGKYYYGPKLNLP